MKYRKITGNHQGRIQEKQKGGLKVVKDLVRKVGRGGREGVGMGGGASPFRLAGGELFIFLHFAHTMTFELSY